MEDIRDELVAATIRDAWADVPYPGDAALTGSDSCCGEYGYVAGFFRGRHWRDVTLDTLQAYEGPANACYAFMSGAALRFYLPAFMMIALEEPLAGARSDWEASLVAVAVWALNPPRYRPGVHAVERTLTQNPGTSPQSMARLREWWDERMQPLTAAQKQGILAFLERMHERHRFDDQAEALEHWRGCV